MKREYEYIAEYNPYMIHKKKKIPAGGAELILATKNKKHAMKEAVVTLKEYGFPNAGINKEFIRIHKVFYKKKLRKVV